MITYMQVWHQKGMGTISCLDDLSFHNKKGPENVLFSVDAVNGFKVLFHFKDCLTGNQVAICADALCHDHVFTFFV